MKPNHSLYQPKALIKLFYLWSIYFIKNFIRKERFVAITPPFSKTQYLLDRQVKKFFMIQIRDGVDWTQMEHIYLCCDYDLSSSSRYSEIKAYYEYIVNNGKAPLIIDCGANIGLASKYFFQTYPGSKVAAIEPDAGNFAMAKINNENSNIDLYRAAISSEVGEGSLIDMGAANAFRVTKGVEGNLDFITVNSILDSNSGCIPFIIKIDIEGFESDLFSENIEWIDRFPIIMIELHDWMLPKSNNSRSFLKAISGRDRDFIHHSGYILSISNQFE